MWKRRDISFSDHIEAWQMHVAKNANPVQLYLLRRCQEMDVSYALLMSRTRGKRFVVDARAKLMWEVRTKFPTVSYSQMGKIFGRDHTSCISAVQKIEQARESAAHAAF
jgi:chromosomal replication initiation ATPase DnaA